MVLTTCKHTNIKLGNLHNNKADDSYTAEHIKESELFPIYIYIFNILKINLLKEGIIKYGNYDNR